MQRQSTKSLLRDIYFVAETSFMYILRSAAIVLISFLIPFIFVVIYIDIDNIMSTSILIDINNKSSFGEVLIAVIPISVLYIILVLSFLIELLVGKKTKTRRKLAIVWVVPVSFLFIFQFVLVFFLIKSRHTALSDNNLWWATLYSIFTVITVFILEFIMSVTAVFERAHSEG